MLSNGWKPEQEWYVRCARRIGEKRTLAYYTYSGGTDVENRQKALDFALKVRNQWDTVEIGQRDKRRIRRGGIPYWWPKSKKSNKQAQDKTLCIPGVAHGKSSSKV